MKKLYSLIKASMTSDMNLFKIKSNGNRSNFKFIIFISFCLMFTVWSNVNLLFEKLSPFNLQYVVISIGVFSTSIMTIIEGIYKSGSLIFNSKDDELLLSLPIKKSTILFIKIFKFYIFELLFNSLFLVPIIFSYIRWVPNINYTYYITSIIMLFILPIIPIIISCIIGFIISFISSKFKYKNIVQIFISMLFILLIMYYSFNLDNNYNYLVNNAININNLIAKLYYPSYIYAKLVTNFNIIDLVSFILLNIILLIISILILSKFYYKINSRLKTITHNKIININNITIKSKNIYSSLIKKELNTFFKTPVYIINAGFGLVLYLFLCIIICLKYDSIIPILISNNGFSVSKEIIMNNSSIFILILIVITSYMTSITSSSISLEGKCINILKTLPIRIKTILMSKIYSSLLITTPIILLGNIILFFKFKINIFEFICLIILSFLIPLVSHFIGIIINLNFPKLNYNNSTEVVKQSTSSLLSVTLGIILLIINIIFITKMLIHISSLILLIIYTIIYLIINYILYIYLNKFGKEKFKKLSI